MIEEVIDEKEKQDEKPETQIAITTHPSSITRDLIYISKFIIHSFTTIAGSLGDLHLKPVFPILIQTARKIVDWKGHSIEKARHWQKLVPPTIILNGLTPLEISYTAFSFTANYQKILDSELDGYKNNGLGEYYIPDEVLLINID